jgi:hypothetical protein
MHRPAYVMEWDGIVKSEWRRGFDL